MSFEQLDIWNRAMYSTISFIDLTEEEPKTVFNGYVYVGGVEDPEGKQGIGYVMMKLYSRLPLQEGGFEIHKDFLINMLYFAAFRANAGVKAFFKGKNVTVGYDELRENSDTINQLSAMTAYRFGGLKYEEFFEDFKDQKVYSSTPFGEDADGNPQAYLLGSGEDDGSYYPAFLSLGHIQEFFEDAGREDYIVWESTFGEFTETVRNTFKGLPQPDLVIEPMYPMIATKVPLKQKKTRGRIMRLLGRNS
jgi:hypothetical protein